MPAENDGKEQPKRRINWRYRNKHKQTPIAGLATFTDAYKKEQKTNRKQEGREDRGKKWIEIWTLGFIILTTGGIFVQDWILNRQGHSFKEQLIEMRNAYGPLKESADAAKKSVDASISTERARLFLGNTTFIRNGDKDRTPKVTFQIINLGKTGVLISGISYECAVVPSRIDFEPTYAPKAFHTAQEAIGASGILVVPPGSECVLDAPITDDDFTGLEGKTEIILLKGFARFEDVFGEKFTKRFAAYSLGKDGGFFPLGPQWDSYSAETKEQ
jgi:hypothetical protein